MADEPIKSSREPTFELLRIRVSRQTLETFKREMQARDETPNKFLAHLLREYMLNLRR